MSIRLMSQVWDIPTDTPAEKLILLALADRADDEGNNVRPAKGTIATRCCLDRRTVQRIMAKLEEQRVLVLVAERIGFPSVYRLDVRRLKQLADGPDQPTEQGAASCHTPAEGVRHHAAGGAATDHRGVRSDAAGGCGTTPPNTSEQPSEHPSDRQEGDLAASAAIVVPDFAKDWPTLHVKDGDYEVREPYASCPELREAMIEWVKARKADKRKGMPTVYGLRVTNCGWWDKYPLAAVVHAVQRAAGGQWQGIIEDVAREWKPEPGSAASVNGKSVRHGVQTMVQTMEQRQQMIRAAAAQNGQAHALGAGNESEA